MNKMKNIENCIGNTPIIELRHEFVPNDKKLFLKLEWFNPTFSIKDRTAMGLVKSAFATGELKPGGILIESTSGNLGKSLAMFGAILKFKVILVVDPKISTTLLNWYKAYGAETIMVSESNADGGYQEARIRKIKELLKQYPEAYWPNQYDNKANANYHYFTTAAEITEMQVDAVVGAVSTGGHLCGIARRIKEKQHKTTIIACDVEGSAIFSNKFKPYLINGIGLSWRSDNTDISLLDQICIVSDQEAISICRTLARETGILAGGSSGAVIFCALAWLSQSNANTALAIIPDAGISYLDQIYNDEWLEKKRIALLESDRLKFLIRNKFILHVKKNTV